MMVDSKEKELGLIDLSGELNIETLRRHKEAIKEKLPQLTVLGVYAGKMKFSWLQAYQLGLEGIELPPELLWKTEKQMDEDEMAQYRLHPGFAKLTLQKSHKLSETVLEAILLHHERRDGCGYPYGLKSEKIPMDAKILTFADEFDKQTSLWPGFPQLTPREAIIKLAGLEGNGVDPVFDSDSFKPLITLFYEAPMIAPKSEAVDLERGVTLKEWLAKNLSRNGSRPLASTEMINKLRLQLSEHFKTN